MNSKTAEELFLSSSLERRFRFIRDHIALPFRASETDVIEGEADVSRGSLSQVSRFLSKSAATNAVMTSNEKANLRTSIRARLSQPPYSGAFLFQEFAQRNNTYADLQDAPAEDPTQIVNSLMDSIPLIDDEDLHDYIKQTGGRQLVSIFTKYQAFLVTNDTLLPWIRDAFSKEISGFIERL